MKPNKLTKDQILAIPELLKVHTRTELAFLYNVGKETISRWAKVLKERGYDIPPAKRGPKPILD